MHPCCWGNLLQGLVQLVPVLAILLVGGKKLFEAIRQSLPTLKRQTTKPGKTCCGASNSESTEVVTPVEIGLGRAK
jgi:hypothetical protein